MINSEPQQTPLRATEEHEASVDLHEQKLRTMLFELGKECLTFAVALPAHIRDDIRRHKDDRIQADQDPKLQD